MESGKMTGHIIEMHYDQRWPLDFVDFEVFQPRICCGFIKKYF